jgi:hypothetical protein
MNRSGFDPISQFHIERDGLGRGLGRGLERGRDARSLYWGKWLALGNGWMQRSDLQTDVDLASLPVIQMETAFIASARHQAKIYEAPQASSRVITILMPETEMSLSGRSSDGEWLAVGDGWIQADDVRTDTDLAALPILNVATVVDQVAGK